MGMSTDEVQVSAKLAVAFRSPGAIKNDGLELSWNAEHCMIPFDDVPTIDFDQYIQLPGNRTIRFPSLDLLRDRMNEDFYREFAYYEYARRLFRPLELRVQNVGSIEAKSICVELESEGNEGLLVAEEHEIPNLPKRKSSFELVSGPGKKSLGSPRVEQLEDFFSVQLSVPNLQPGRQHVCDPFFLGVRESQAVTFRGVLYASNLPNPMEFTLVVNADVKQSSLTVDELIELADKVVES